jgi:hypothetical protein
VGANGNIASKATGLELLDAHDEQSVTSGWIGRGDG